MRLLHIVVASGCQAGRASYALQALPLPDHATSDQPRALPSWVRVVEPTATTPS